MKKFKSLSFVVVGAWMLIASGPLRPAFAGGSEFTVLDSTTVQVSSYTATKILSGTNNANAWVMLYASQKDVGDTIAIGSDINVSTVATTGYFRFPVNTMISLFDYKGPLWAIVVGTTPTNVSVLRKR